MVIIKLNTIRFERHFRMIILRHIGLVYTIYIKYLKNVWKKLILIIALFLFATIFTTLKPIVAAGIIETTLKK
jgi:hypothetical protein